MTLRHRIALAAWLAAVASTFTASTLRAQICRGEILTLLGPSGCGKTTTLRLVIGLERCADGEITYEGRLVDSPRKRVFLPPHKRNMGMVFQSYAIWPHMTVFSQVAYPLQARRVARARR